MTIPDQRAFGPFGPALSVLALAVLLALVPVTGGLASATDPPTTVLADPAQGIPGLDSVDELGPAPLDGLANLDHPRYDDARRASPVAWAEEHGAGLADLEADGQPAGHAGVQASEDGQPFSVDAHPFVDQIVVVDDDREQCPQADARLVEVGVQLAEPGSTIAVCPGTYEESVTVDVPGLTLRAVDDSTLPRVVAPNTDGEAVVVGDGIEDQGGDTGFAIKTRGVTLEGFRIEGHQDAGILAYGLYGGFKGKIVNNSVVGNERGFLSIADMRASSEPTGTALLEGNTFVDNRVGADLRFDNHLTLRDNRLEDNTYNFWAKGTQNVDTSNTVDGKPIYYLVGASGLVIDGNEPGMDPGYVGLINSVGVTVQNLELSNNGQGVLVQGGSETQVRNVSVTTSVEAIEIQNTWFTHLEEVDVENATTGIDLSQATGASVVNADIRDIDTGVDLWSDSVSIVNTTVERSEKVSVLATGSDIDVTDNTFLDQGGHSVWFAAMDGGRIENNTIEGRGANTSYEAVVVAPVYRTPSTDVTIANNQISKHHIGAVSVGSVNTEMRSNTITDSTAGLLSWQTDGDHMIENEARDNRIGAITWGQTPGLTIEANTFANNENGTWVNSTAGSGDAIEITGNALKDNARRGMLVGFNVNGGQLDISENTIVSNGWYGIDAPSLLLGTVDARNNYWGAADGPSSPNASSPLEDPVTGALADGAGDGVSEDDDEEGVASVRFDPWLTQPPE